MTELPPSPRVTGEDVLTLAALAGLAALTLSPLRHYLGPPAQVAKEKHRRDSFPLSTFPMFSDDRRGRIVVPHVIGITADGRRVAPHHRHFGAGGLNQVRRQLARAVRQGRAGAVAQRYADSLAADRAAGRAERSPGERAITQVRVVRSRFLFDRYAPGSLEPHSEALAAECLVGGTAVAHGTARLPRHDEDAAR